MSTIPIARAARNEAGPRTGLNLRGLLRLMTVGPQTDLAYRTALVFDLLFVVTQVFLYAALWRSLYSAGVSGPVAGIAYQGAVTYSTLAVLQSFVLTGPEGFIRSGIRDGSISYGLLRPAGYLTQLFAQSLGSFCYQLVWLGIGLATAALLGVAHWPETWQQMGLYATALVLGQLVNYQLRLLLGLTAFWTIELWGIHTVFNFTSRLLGGAVVPLWFFPDWLLTAVAALPFAATAHVPLSIFIGRLAGADAWRAIGLQALWIVLLAVAANLVWRLAERKVVVQGG